MEAFGWHDEEKLSVAFFHLSRKEKKSFPHSHERCLGGICWVLSCLGKGCVLSSLSPTYAYWFIMFSISYHDMNALIFFSLFFPLSAHFLVFLAAAALAFSNRSLLCVVCVWLWGEGGARGCQLTFVFFLYKNFSCFLFLYKIIISLFSSLTDVFFFPGNFPPGSSSHVWQTFFPTLLLCNHARNSNTLHSRDGRGGARGGGG